MHQGEFGAIGRAKIEEARRSPHNGVAEGDFSGTLL
jgi:hypothetical protein